MHEEKKGSVTINNNYNSSVIAVISKDPGSENQQRAITAESSVPEKSAAINIFVNEPKKPETAPIDKLMSSQFTEISNQSNKLHALTTGLPEPDNKEHIMDRLLQSVNMVKEVLHSNLKLREQVQELSQKVDFQNAELFHLQCENEEQKDKIQILAGMNDPSAIPSVTTKSPTNNEPEIDKEDISLEDESKKQARIDVAEEILQLKKDKSMLEQRVHYLEVENIHMHTKNVKNEKPANLPGTDDFEPVRSVLNGNELNHKGQLRKYGTSTQSKKLRRQVRGNSEMQQPPRSSYAKLRNIEGSNKLTSIFIKHKIS